MSLVREAILSVAREGEITHSFTIKGLDIVLRPIKTEEQFLADGMIPMKKLREKYGAKDLMTLNDTIQKYRTVAMMALSTKTINGQSPVDDSLPLEEQYKQRQELIEELMELPTSAVDEITREFNKLAKKLREFYTDSENVEKS